MIRRKPKTAWAIFSLFVWLHLAPNLLPLPLQDTKAYDKRAEDLIKTIRSLELQGVGTGKHSKITKQQLDKVFSREYRKIWIETFLLIFFGLLATYLLYINSRYWPFLLGIVSLIIIIRTFPPTINLVLNSISFESFYWLWFCSDRIYSFYIIFIWPLFSAILLGLSVIALVKRKTHISKDVEND